VGTSGILALILHLGDDYCRETPCKGPSAPCIPDRYGDIEETWRADFFTPARDLPAKTPGIFARGNHEDCLRGGFGWHYCFSDSAASCDLVHPPAHIAFKGRSRMTQVIVRTDGASPDRVAKELTPPAMDDFEFEDRRLALIDGR